MSGDGLRVLLAQTGQFLRDLGRWPTFAEIDRALDREHNLDAARLLRDAPVRLIIGDRASAGSRGDATFLLTVRGLCVAGFVVEAMELVGAIRCLADIERVADVIPEGGIGVTADEIADRLGIAGPTRSIQLERLHSLMVSAPGVWTSLGGSGSAWTVTISREIRRYREVTSVRSYLEVVDSTGSGPQRSADFATLLNEVDELRLSAVSLQRDDNGDTAVRESVELLVDQYQRWYAASLSVLPADLCDRFRGEYEGSSWTNKIRRFLEAPLATNEDAKALFASSDGPSLPIGHWRYPVASTFISPLQAQALILREAQARPTRATQDDGDLLVQVLERVGQLVRELGRRRQDRNPFLVVDEYDLQDVVRGLLRTLFDDVRAEDPLPTHAGGSSRVDFVLPEIATLLELKVVRERGRDRRIGEELAVDIVRYRAAHPAYRRLVALIYDPEHLLANAAGLRSDLSRRDGDFEIVVVIAR